MSDIDDLYNELSGFANPKSVQTRSPREERIIAGFEEIQKFIAENGRAPEIKEGNDIFERIYAVRLNALRQSNESMTVLADLDATGLLQNYDSAESTQEISVDELRQELDGIDSYDDITKLKHVKTREEKRVSEEIAQRSRCLDFSEFKPLFEAVQNELDQSLRTTKRFRRDAGFAKADIKQGQFIIISGQTAYVANIGAFFKAPNGEDDARLRVIYSNGTESDILLRSLIRAMYKDESSRIISEPNAGPLFSDVVTDEDIESGTIYVLRSKSDDPFVKESRDVVHKIGATGGDLNKRFGNAKNDPTFLMAEVEIVATYKLSNINRVKLEQLIHRFFEPAKLNIEITDRFGKPILPREWFLAPLPIIEDAIDKLVDGSIVDFEYDPKTAAIVER